MDRASLRRKLATEALTPASLMLCARHIGEFAQQAEQAGDKPPRVALACDLTPDLLAHAVSCAIAQEGQWPLLHVAPFGTARQQCLDITSSLHTFRPSVVILVPDWRDTIAPLPAGASRDAADAADEASLHEFEAIWTAMQGRGCTVIQHLLAPPPLRLRGVADRLNAASVNSRVRQFNEALLQAGAGRVTFLETDRLAEQIGTAAWAAPRFYHAGKLAFDPRYLPQYVPSLRGAWRSATGSAKKLLVLDLDDTLWGGVIGDDGPEGIALGPGHGGRGEAFAAWQRYLSELGRRGVVLAVCSKNAPGLASAGFDHPDSALRQADFAAVVCNWEDKVSGLRRIAAELQLAPQAMVFVDDNPAERELVAQMMPEVAVVDLGTDPAQFIERFEAGHWFDLQAYTDADLGRSAAYAGIREALQTREQKVDLQDYLASLQMTARLAPAQPTDLPRLAQMELKTNQFNLSARRYSQAQLTAFLGQADRLVLAFHLKDRFADHGLVSSLVAVREGDVLRIDSWLMSCRVLGRTAEQFIMAGLARMAREMGAQSLTGEYTATERNGVVADLYARLGFEPMDAQGRFWRRDLAGPLNDAESPIADAQSPSPAASSNALRSASPNTSGS